MIKKKALMLFLVFALLSTQILFFASFAADGFDRYRISSGGKFTGYYGYFIKNTPYLPVTMIGSYANNPNISVDTAGMRLVIPLSTQNIMLGDDATTNFVKTHAGTIYIPLTEIDGTICFPLNVTDQFFKLAYTISEKSIRLAPYSGTDQIARVNSPAAAAVSLVNQPAAQEDFDEGEIDETNGGESVAAKSISLEKGARVFITGETDNYYIIETAEVGAAYILKSQVTISDLNLASLDFYAPKKNKWKQGAQRINLAWHYVDHITPEAPPKYDGLDVISPTWFDLITDGDGSVENNGDKGYTDLSHQRGYQVWATITNNMSTTGSTKFTTRTFKEPALFNRSIAQYLFYACLYDVDGINIDYEDVTDSDAAGLVKFTKTLRDYSERQGLVLSIDTLIPKPWTIEYDRKALAKYVDYLAVMTYDEHYSSSPQPGSISSLPWTEQAIKDTLAEGVPAGKILMGIPLYTRVWCIDSAGKIVSNKAATMTFMQTTLKEKNLTPVYLDAVGQNYIEYPDGQTTAKVWIEDASSIRNRLNLAKKYNLAGTACWQFTQGTSDIWSVFAAGR